MAKIDLTKYAAMVANAASQVKISSTIFKNFIADVKAVIDGNDDIVIAHKAETKSQDVHGLAFKGALIVMNSNQSISSGTTSSGNTLTFSSAIYDTHSFWNGANSFQIPSGVSRVRFSAMVIFANNSTGYRTISIFKNASASYAGAGIVRTVPLSAEDTRIQVITAILSVTAGDSFNVRVQQNSGSALDVVGNGYFPWFMIEVIE